MVGVAVDRAITRRHMLLALLAMPWARAVKPSPARKPIFRDLASEAAAFDAVTLSQRWVSWSATRPTHSLPHRATRSAE